MMECGDEILNNPESPIDEQLLTALKETLTDKSLLSDFNDLGETHKQLGFEIMQSRK